MHREMVEYRAISIIISAIGRKGRMEKRIIRSFSVVAYREF